MSGGEASLGELIGRLRDDSIALVKAEVALARAELVDRVRSVRGALVPAVVALAALHVGVLALSAAAVLALGEALGGRYALAGALVGVVFLVVAGTTALVVVRKLRRVSGESKELTVPGKFAVEVIHDRTKQG